MVNKSDTESEDEEIYTEAQGQRGLAGRVGLTVMEIPGAIHETIEAHILWGPDTIYRESSRIRQLDFFGGNVTFIAPVPEETERLEVSQVVTYEANEPLILQKYCLTYVIWWWKELIRDFHRLLNGGIGLSDNMTVNDLVVGARNTDSEDGLRIKCYYKFKTLREDEREIADGRASYGVLHCIKHLLAYHISAENAEEANILRIEIENAPKTLRELTLYATALNRARANHRRLEGHIV
eukprot:sb/3469157/